MARWDVSAVGSTSAPPRGGMVVVTIGPGAAFVVPPGRAILWPSTRSCHVSSGTLSVAAVGC